MSAYRPYPKYKPSGVEWLGDVPEHWDIMALRRCLIEHRQGYYTQSAYVDAGVKLLRITDLRGYGRIDFSECPRVEELPELLPFLLKRSDFVFARTGGAGTFGLVPPISESVAYASYLIRFRFSKNTDSNFLRYFFLSPSFQEPVKKSIHGGVNQNIHAEDIKDQLVNLPPLPEQIQIASFLDRECGKLDALQAKQERLIELLKEKRQALISHAVTKGLDPNAKLKPSGIEWLGDVPEHWRVCRVKHVAKLESGHTPSKTVPEYWEDCNIPWVSLNDTKQLKDVDYITETALQISELGMRNSSAHLLPARAVIFTRDATIGLAAITTRPMAVSQHIIAWICKERLVVPEYLLLVFYGMASDLERFTAGATLKTIGMPDVNKLSAAIPPLEEQHAIVERIFRKVQNIDATMAKAERAIALLKERRSALISAAVTGKIDVRESAV